MNTHNKLQYNKGQVLMAALLLFLTISITVLVGIATPVAIQVRTASDFLQSKQGYISADVLNEEVLFRLNKGRTVPSSIVLSFNDATSTALISDVNGTKEVISTGVSGAFSRLSKSVFSQQESFGFENAIQAGDGKILMNGTTNVTGTIISNNSIIGAGTNRVTGNVSAAFLTPSVVDQSNGTGTPMYFRDFGVSSGQQIAQSFVVSTTTPLSRIMLYIKRTGVPPGLTLYITTNTTVNGLDVPAGGNIGRGAIAASQVSTAGGWVPVVISNTPALVPGEKYWIAVESIAASQTRFYEFGTIMYPYNILNHSVDTYIPGQLIMNSQFSSWSSQNTDLFFQIYLGGNSVVDKLIVTGNTIAPLVKSSTVSGALSCQYGLLNNKACAFATSTPTPVPFPFSESNMTSWKNEASAGRIHTGNMTITGTTATSTGGALKIEGNLTLSNTAQLTVEDTLYVTGNIILQGSSRLRINPSNPSNATLIITDGYVDKQAATVVLAASSTPGKFLVITSTSPCGGLVATSTPACFSRPAIGVVGGTSATVLLAPNGMAQITGTASVKSITAYSVTMANGSSVVYDNALLNLDLGARTSGSGSSWLTDTWKEIYQ